jgi:uncharacterized membrane protein YvlD (DUF360 family)
MLDVVIKFLVGIFVLVVATAIILAWVFGAIYLSEFLPPMVATMWLPLIIFLLGAIYKLGEITVDLFKLNR